MDGKIRKNYHFISLLIFILCFSCINISAQVTRDSSILQVEKRLPIINNFSFITTDVISDPFINTYVKLNLGSGEALDLQSYVRNLHGNIIDTLSGNIAYISGELEFQYAINERLAIMASYGGYARLGSNAYTILTSGFSYSEGLTIGGKMKIMENENMILSGSIDYSLNQVFLYSVYEFVKEVYEAGGIDDSVNASLLEKENLPNIFIGANYAYAPVSYFGILGVAGFGVGKVFDSKLKGNVRLGVAASVDFLNVQDVNFPAGLLFSTRYNSFAESGEDVKDLFTIGLKLSYTGHKDFDIGVESIYQSLKYNKNYQRVKTILMEFEMLYYF